MRAWLLAARPATLPASLAPVLLGTAHAVRDGSPHWGAAAAALAGALLIQIGTNLVNDVEDFERGADDAQRLGPVRAVERGLLTAAQVRRGAVLCFAVAAAVGLYLVYLGGLPILMLGIASIAAGIAYTAGPLPLAYIGIGDLFVFAFFGLAAVSGTYYVQTGAVTLAVASSGAAMGALATAILAVNNTRDVDSDRRAGKRTLAVRCGATATRVEYVAMLALAAAAALLVAALVGSAWPLLSLLPAASGVALARRLYASHGAALNPLLRDTARLQLAFAALLALGLLL